MQQKAPAPQSLNVPIPTPNPPEPPIPSAPVEPPLLFIPDSDLLAWKPYAAATMKAPSKAMDIDSIVLHMLSPFRSLQLEGLLNLQKYLTATHNSRILNLPASSLAPIINALEKLCSHEIMTARKIDAWTFESLLAEEDQRRRDCLADHSDKRDGIIEQVSLTLQLLIVTRPELAPRLATFPFISSFLHFSLLKCDSVEVKINSFIILESLSAFLPASQQADELLSWSLQQSTRELKQISGERMKSASIKVLASLQSLTFDNFESLPVARQTTNLVIGTLGQFWKSVPSHLFSLLAGTLHLLCNRNTSASSAEDGKAGAELVTELAVFVELFMIPICVLVRSIRSYVRILIEDTRSDEELKKILETLIFSPAFSLSDGGYLELSLQLILKCFSKSTNKSSIKLDTFLVLVEEMRNLWLLPPFHVQLGKSCFATALPPSNGSPKRSRLASIPVVTNELAITKGSSAITSAYSHPFMLLSQSLELLSTNFDSLSPETKLRLFELCLEWSSESTGHCRQVLNCDRLDASLARIREKFFNDFCD